MDHSLYRCRLEDSPSIPVRTVVISLLALLLASYGHWQSLQLPQVRTIEISLEKLPPKLDGFSLIQLTDIHIGPLFKGDWLAKVVEKTNEVQPDLVVLTGDMIDGNPKDLHHEISPLSELKSRYGVYGVTGNHEYYFGANNWLPVFADLGITMLHNEYRMIGTAPDAQLVLAGVPDRTQKLYNGSGPDVTQAFTGAPDSARILLAHRPIEINSSQDEYLQLSGHTHGGHLFFMQWLISSFNGGLVNGLYHIDDKLLYISPGTGLWAGFSCRLGVPAEITRIVLRSKVNMPED